MDDETVIDVDMEMQRLAQAADSGVESPDDSSTTTGSDEQPGAETPKPGEAKVEKAAETQPAATDKTTQEPSPQEADDEPKEGDSAFVKAQKERKRFDRNWQKLQAEKEQLVKERAVFDSVRQKPAEENVQRPTSNAQPPTKDAAGYTAADYEAAAREFEKDGDGELAKAARDKAAGLKDGETKAAAEQQQQAFHKTWQDTLNKTVEAEAELKNYEGPLSKKVQELLKTDAVFSQLPDGFARAVGRAKLELAAGSVPELKGQIEKLSKELAKAHARLGLDGNNPAKPAVAKKMADMTMDEQDAEIRAMLKNADGIGD